MTATEITPKSAPKTDPLSAGQVREKGPTPAGTRRRTRANGEGGVRHDKARGRWVGTFTTGYDAQGRQLRRSVTGPTKAVVLERMREATNAAAAGQTPAP